MTIDERIRELRGYGWVSFRTTIQENGRVTCDACHATEFAEMMGGGYTHRWITSDGYHDLFSDALDEILAIARKDAKGEKR